MEWDEFLNYMHITNQVAQLKDILQSDPNGTSDTDTINFQQQIKQHELCMNLNNECTKALDKIENSLLYMKDNLSAEFEAIECQIKKEYQKLDESNYNWPYIFGIPYFKDHNSFSPPPNSDTVNMKARNFVSTVNLPPGHMWKTDDKSFLLNCVKKYTMQKMKKVCKFGPKINEMNNLNDNLNEKDWAQMPLNHLKDRHGLLECIGMWNSYLNPKFNKNKWTRDEENRLKFYASKYKFQDWEAVARELNTNRSPYQCIVHHQTHFNKNVSKKKWTEEENKQLEKLIQQYQLGEYIPWAKVASHMVGRTKFQVYNHWAYTLQPNIKKGRFTKLEDAIILAGIKKFGTDYGRISRFLKDRTSIQIRNRFNTFLQYQQGYEPWTPEEDVLLVKLVKKLGKGNWSQISNSFRNRNRTQLRHRYSAIMNWMKKNPDKELNIQNRKVHSKIGGPQEIWESILNESDIEDDNLTEVINEMGLEDVTRDKTQKYAPHMLTSKFLDLLKNMYITQDSELELNFSKDEIISLCKLLERQLKLVQCLTPFNWNYIENDSTFFECTNTVLQSVSQALIRPRYNDHTENYINVSENELYGASTSSEHSFSESGRLNFNLNPTLLKMKERRVQQLLNSFPHLDSSNSENASVEELNGNAVYNNFEMQNTDKIYRLVSNPVNEKCSEQCVDSEANIVNVPRNDDQEDPGNQEMSFNFTHSTNFDTDSNRNESDLEQIGNYSHVMNDSDFQCPSDISRYINELMKSSTGFIRDCEIPTIVFYTPPSHTTLVGFYTLLLNLETIKKFAASRKSFAKVKGTKRTNSSKHLTNFSSSETERAAILWKQRFFSVFLWPKLMSINSPEQYSVKNSQQETSLLTEKTSRRKSVKLSLNKTERKKRASKKKQKTCTKKIAAKTKVNKRLKNQEKGKNTVKKSIESKHVQKRRRKKN